MASNVEMVIKSVSQSAIKAVFAAMALESLVQVATVTRLQHLRTQARRKGRPGWRHHPVMSRARISRMVRSLEAMNSKRAAIEADRIRDVREMVQRLPRMFHSGGLVGSDMPFHPIIERGTEYLVPHRAIETKELRTLGEQEVITVSRVFSQEQPDEFTGSTAIDGEFRNIPADAWDRLAATLGAVGRSPSEGVGRSPPVIGPRKPPVFRLTPGARMQIGRTWYVAVSRPDGSTMMVKEKPEPL